MTAEAGLFVVWSAAEHATSRVLSAIEERFHVARVVRCIWTPECVDENYARFLGGPAIAPYDAAYGDAVGRGPFTVALVVDRQPRREAYPTTAGARVINENFVAAERSLQALAGGVDRVHGSASAAEAARDAMLLLGEAGWWDPAGPEPDWDGTIELIERDLAGAGGWSSMRELFAVLNHAICYVVLRNFERLPDDFVYGIHNDVDLLTDDYPELIRLLNARPMLGRVPRWGGRFFVQVGGEDVIFDLRFIGDRYYDERWERRLLDNRRLVRATFYAPPIEDYLESMAYHAVIHKRDVAADYCDRLADMASRLGRGGWEHRQLLDEPERLPALVHEAVARRGYAITRPRDVTVFFNYANAGVSFPRLRRKAAGLRREMTERTARIASPAIRALASARREIASRASTLRRRPHGSRASRRRRLGGPLEPHS